MSSVGMYSGIARISGILVRRKTVLLGTVMLLLAVVVSMVVPEISPYGINQLDLAQRLMPPAPEHLLGSDGFGRDILTRLAYAGRVSLVIGVAVVVLSALAGITLGLLAGFERRLDAPISRLLDAMMSFPDVLLAIALVAALGPTMANVIIALSIVYTPRFARIVRASTLVIRELPYVEAARALGVPTATILYRHVLRNVMSPVLVQGTFIMANAMLAEAGLSFLGVGVSPNIPTWGTMIAQGRQHIDTANWIMLFPGLAIVATVLSLQLVGDGLRDELDPRLSGET